MLSDGIKWYIGLRTPRPPVGGWNPPTPARLDYNAEVVELVDTPS